ncbi:MAG: ferredoxin reductase family protein [Acidimicrobiales bacterium]
MATATFAPTATAPRRNAKRAPRVGPSAPPPHPLVGKVAVVAACAGLVVSVGLGVSVETHGELLVPGGVATFMGNLTGLAGMYLALLMVLIVARIPLLEHILGQDGMLRWHRRLGPWPISLIAAHALLTTVGYAQAAKTGVFHELGVLLRSYPDMLAATAGLGLMIAAGIASIRAIRSRMRRETWWILHLYLYLALALSFAHVIVLGQSFVGHPLVRVGWSVLWAATAGVVLLYRIVLPVLRSVRHRLEVVEVRPEVPGVVSVICTGRDLDRLAVSGGQFFAWRFLARGMWWQAHPYSLSALPQPPYLRLTVKQIGDHSSAVARLRPGTRVAIEGPYGAFTASARRHERVVLIAGGIGITALRSLLEDLPRGSDPVVLVRASSEEQLVFRSEVAELVRHRKGHLHELVGTRREVVMSGEVLRKLVPDLHQRDIYICGPPAFVDEVVATARHIGVASSSVHFEAFSW